MGVLKLNITTHLPGARIYVRISNIAGTKSGWLRRIADENGNSIFSASYPSSWGSDTTCRVTHLYAYKYPDHYVNAIIKGPKDEFIANSIDWYYFDMNVAPTGGNLRAVLLDSLTGSPILNDDIRIFIYYEKNEFGGGAADTVLIAPRIEEGSGYYDSVLGNAIELISGDLPQIPEGVADNSNKHNACCKPGEFEYTIGGSGSNEYIIRQTRTILIPESGYVDLGTIYITTYATVFLRFIEEYSGQIITDILDFSIDCTDVYGDSLNQKVSNFVTLRYVPGGRHQIRITGENLQHQTTINVAAEKRNEFTISIPIKIKASGKITDKNGRPISGVKLTFGLLNNPSKEAYIPDPVYTRADGTWLVGNLNYWLPLYKVTPTKDGYIFGEASVHNDDVSYQGTGKDIYASFYIRDGYVITGINFTVLQEAEQVEPIQLTFKNIPKTSTITLNKLAIAYNGNFRNLQAHLSKQTGPILLQKPLLIEFSVYDNSSQADINIFLNTCNDNFGLIESKLNVSMKKLIYASSAKSIANAYNENFRNLEAYINKRR